MEGNTNSMNPNFETNQNKRYANFKNLNIKNCNSIKKKKKTSIYYLTRLCQFFSSFLNF